MQINRPGSLRVPNARASLAAMAVGVALVPQAGAQSPAGPQLEEITVTAARRRAPHSPCCAATAMAVASTAAQTNATATGTPPGARSQLEPYSWDRKSAMAARSRA